MGVGLAKCFINEGDMTFLKKPASFFDWLLNSLSLLTCAIILIVMVAVCLNVIMRYAFNRPIMGVEEITEYLLLVITFIGSAWLLREEGHVGVDILLVRQTMEKQAFFGVISSLIGVFICAVLTWYGAKVTWTSLQEHAYFPSLLEMPKSPVYAVIPFGSFLLLLQFLRRTARDLTAWRSAGKEKRHGREAGR